MMRSLHTEVVPGLKLIVAIVFNLMVQSVYANGNLVDMSMPGRLVDVGTHRMHINCRGHKNPTVVIDSGLGGFSLEWVKVQEHLSQHSRVCTYDRSGYGWSEVSPNPRTSSEISKELYLLLVNGDVPGPYLLVGHSFGGYNIRYFASEYPNLVSGLIFVDASHPEQYTRMPRHASAVNNPKRMPMTLRIKMTRPQLSSNFPAEYRNIAYIKMASVTSRMTQIAELDNFITSAEQVMTHDYLPDVPITVITRGKRVWPHNVFGDASERVWSELQGELVKLSRTSTQVIARNSGHSVHLDEPELVEKVVARMVEASRQVLDPRVLLVDRNDYPTDGFVVQVSHTP